MGYSRAEQETSIVWDEEEKVAHVYTASPTTMRKLDKLCAEHPGLYKCLYAEAGGSAKKYSVPSRYLRFSKPASAATIEAARRNAEHMRAAMQQKQEE